MPGQVSRRRKVSRAGVDLCMSGRKSERGRKSEEGRERGGVVMLSNL